MSVNELANNPVKKDLSSAPSSCTFKSNIIKGFSKYLVGQTGMPISSYVLNQDKLQVIECVMNQDFTLPFNVFISAAFPVMTSRFIICFTPS